MENLFNDTQIIEVWTRIGRIAEYFITQNYEFLVKGEILDIIVEVMIITIMMMMISGI